MPPIKLVILSASAGIALTACASNVARTETLSRYDQLEEGERALLPVREYADAEAAAGIGAIYVERAEVAPGVLEDSGVEAESFDRVVSTLSGTMCRRLARGNVEVTSDMSGASHRLEMTITGFEATDPVAAGASGVIGFFVPGPLSPRLPVGIGALAVEGELVDPQGEQVAAMQFDARNHLASGAGTFSLLTGDIGATSDARDLAQGFADAFGDLIVNARNEAGAPRGETERGTCDELFDDEAGALSEPQPDPGSDTQGDTPLEAVSD